MTSAQQQQQQQVFPDARSMLAAMPEPIRSKAGRIILGFTGTRKGLTVAQINALSAVLFALQPDEIHHGNAHGADTEFSILARTTSAGCKGRGANGVGPFQVSHPCNIKSQQADCNWPDREELPKSPLTRNWDIVNACELLIACPAGTQEELRSGTWATVRYARRTNRPLVILYADGTCSLEGFQSGGTKEESQE